MFDPTKPLEFRGTTLPTRFRLWWYILTCQVRRFTYEDDDCFLKGWLNTDRKEWFITTFKRKQQEPPR